MIVHSGNEDLLIVKGKQYYVFVLILSVHIVSNTPVVTGCLRKSY